MFELAGGTVIGREHLRLKKNNQDAYVFINEPDLSVAIVADGCGDMKSKYSESGAQIGIQILKQTLLTHARETLTLAPIEIGERFFWEVVRQDVLSTLSALVFRMGRVQTKVVNEHFLFTLVGVLITPKVSVFFTLGDGVFVLNGTRHVLPKYPGNAPPYLGYGLINSTFAGQADLLNFKRLVVPTSGMENFLIGTDGVVDLIDHSESLVPGKSEIVGLIDQFWSDDRYFSNLHSISRRLSTLNEERLQVDWDRQVLTRTHGLLPDDTTLIVGRRLRN